MRGGRLLWRAEVPLGSRVIKIEVPSKISAQSKSPLYSNSRVFFKHLDDWKLVVVSLDEAEQVLGVQVLNGQTGATISASRQPHVEPSLPISV